MVSIDEGKNIDNAVAIAYDENERRMSMFIFFTHKLERSNLCVLDEVTNLDVFLVSEYASYMTGQAINLTGGNTMY